MQRQKTFCVLIGYYYFRRWSPLLMLCMSTVFLNSLYNHSPLLSPISSFQTDLTPIYLCKGRKKMVLQIGNEDFQGWSPLFMLCMSTVFLNSLDNYQPLQSPVSNFLTNTTPLTYSEAKKNSALRIGYCDFTAGPLSSCCA
jgi:hypothetical protein